MSDEEFLTITEAAKAAKLSPSSIYDACQKRLLAHYRLSGSGRRGAIRIKPSDLAAFIERQRVEAEGVGVAPSPITFTHRRPS
jgi:hypothetical protein